MSVAAAGLEGAHAPWSPAAERRAFRVWLLGIVVAGLVVRLVVVALASRDLPFGDGIWYHTQAQIISGGFGYLAPGQFAFQGQHLATAEHPPLFPFLLAIVDWFGGSSVLLFQTTCAVLGAAGIAAIGLLGRVVGGARLGLTAAALCAVAPNVWQYDALLLSESLLVLTLGLFLLSIYRFWDQLKRYRPVRASLEGINAVSTGLTAAAAIVLFEPMAPHWPFVAVVVGTILLLEFTRLPPYVLIFGGLGLGLLL